MIMVNMGTSTTDLLRTHWLSTVTAGVEELLHSMWFLESNFWDSFGELWLVHVEKQVFSAGPGVDLRKGHTCLQPIGTTAPTGFTGMALQSSIGSLRPHIT
jgi:hypothetical protein